MFQREEIKSVKDAKEIFIRFCNEDIYSASIYGDNDELLEQFFDFIDILEVKAKEDKEYYFILSDCYQQIFNMNKAMDCFLQVYDPTNKKHCKKLFNYCRFKSKNIKRPSQRGIVLPRYKYVSKAIASNCFTIDHSRSCSLCGNKYKALYVGDAYDENDHLFSYLDEEDTFCCDCLKQGTAAKAFGISFQTKYIKNLKNIPANKIDELLYRTPGYTTDISTYCEDVWPICCNDFCFFVKETSTEYIFKCKKCKKEYKWDRLAD